MITTGAKFYLGLGIFLFIAASLYGLTSGGADWEALQDAAAFDDDFTSHIAAFIGSTVGAISLGYKGGVGDHLGYVILMFAAVAAFVLGILSVIFRDSNAIDLAEVVGTERAPAPAMASRSSMWGIVSAFGVGLVAIGLVSGIVFWGAGLILLAIVAFEWAMENWSDTATGDRAKNVAVRNQLMGPMEAPIFGVLAVGFVGIAFSRLLLAVSKSGAVIAAGVAALVIFSIAVALSLVPKLRSGVVTGVAVLGALAVLGSGIVGIALGEREIEHHGTDHSSDAEHGGDEEHGEEDGDHGDEEGLGR